MGLFDCFGNMNMPSCIWFEGDKRNAYASMLAGFLVGTPLPYLHSKHVIDSFSSFSLVGGR